MIQYTQKASLVMGLLVWLATFYHGSAVQAQEVIKLEYYLNTDPGFGKGQNIPITPGTDITKSFSVDVNALSAGFHNLYIRSLVKQYTVQEGNNTTTKGGWSLTSVRTFYKETFKATTPLSNVIKGEYFIDADPGFGKGKSFPITPGQDLNNVAFAFDITQLQSGFHNLYVRFQDANKNWSISAVRTFYKESLSAATTVVPNLVKGEYFIDSDPGFGKGINIAITPGTDLSNVFFTADLSNVPPGFHRLYTRFKDAKGNWGQTSVRSMYKEVFSAKDPLLNVVKAEYFIDTDPGFGKGEAIPVTPNTELSNLTFALDMNRVSIGNHKLYVRAQDAKGKWSLTSTEDFVVESPRELVVQVGTINGPFCAGQQVTVPFTVNGEFGSNNIFTAQLSDGNGQFSNPVSIGTLTGKNSGSINATIPTGTFAGTGYRMRVVASSPVSTSTPNAADITINRLPVLGGITGDAVTCTGLKQYSIQSEAGVTYTWAVSGGGTLTQTGNTASVTWNTAGTHTLSVTPANSCGNGEGQIIQVLVFDSAPSIIPTVTASSNWLYASPGTLDDKVYNYQWYVNGGKIIGATSSSYLAYDNGSYTVRYVNPCGESPESNAITFSNSKQNQTISFDAIPEKTYGDQAFSLNASSNAGLPVSLSVIGGPAMVSGNILTITGAGTVTVRASQDGNETYNAATPVDNSFLVKKAAATVALSNLSQTYNGQQLPVGVATNPANLSVIVTYNGNTEIPADASTYTVLATINEQNYMGSAEGSLEIKKATQSIALEDVTDKTYGDTPFKVIAAATSKLPVEFVLSTDPAGIASLSNDFITISGTGIVTVTAKQAGNNNYLAAPDVSDNFTINRANQTISFSNLADKVYGDIPFELSASSTSNLPVSFRVKSGPATITGNSLTITGAGTVEVEAYQDGNINYNPALVVLKTFNVDKAIQAITFVPLGDKTFGDPPFTLSATASSGLDVSFSIVSGPATISGNTVTLTGVGQVVVQANQAGDLNYLSALPVENAFQVNSADRLAQTITFNKPDDKTFGDVPFELSATATSGLDVSFRIVSGQATVLGKTITILGAGDVTVEASQVGDNVYGPATPKVHTFKVHKATPIVSWNRPANIAAGTALSASQLNATASVAGTFQYSPEAGTVLEGGNDRDLSVDFIPQDATNYNTVMGVKNYITVNAAPVLTVTGTTTVKEHDLLTLSSSATDVNGDKVMFSLIGTIPTGMQINAVTGDITWTPSEEQGPNSYSIKVRATDNNTPVLFSEKTINLVVEEVNVVPVLADVPASVTINELVPYTFTAGFSDEDLPANKLTLSLVNAPAGASISEKGIFSWTPAEIQGPGTYSFRVRVSDDGTPALFAEKAIVITVNEVNQLPVLAAITAQHFSTGELVEFVASASDEDLPAQELTFSLRAVTGENYPQGATISNTGSFKWNSANHSHSEYKFMLGVSDSYGGVAEQLVIISLRANNQRPVLAAIGEKTALAGNILGFVLNATDDGLPTGKLTFSATGLPRGATVDAASGVFLWSPKPNQVGTHSITFSVSDGSLSASETVLIHVVRATADAAPRIDSFDPPAGIVGTKVTIMGINFINVNAVLFNGTVATYTVQNESTIHALVPKGATTGTITVSTMGGSSTSRQRFTVLVPEIESFTPISGPVGTRVTITGSNFIDVSEISFNGVPVIDVISSSLTQLVVLVPEGASTGKVGVVTTSGTAYSKGRFTLTAGLSATSVATLSFADELQNSFKIYPNPFKGKATVDLKLDSDGEYDVSLYDTKGVLLFVLKKGNSKAGEIQRIELDGTGLDRGGVYLLRLLTRDHVQTIKVMLHK
jgi:hypothetical protein